MSAQIVSPEDVFGRYRQFVWQEGHGLPQNTVLAITSTRDGYVWVATQEGAARFDGVRFTPFTTANTSAIGNPVVGALLEDRNGGLWLGTYGGGLTRYFDGLFTRYTARDGLVGDFVTCLLADRDGTLWIGTDGTGVSAWRDGRFTRYTVDEGLPSNVVRAFADDGDGGVWIGTGRGIAHVKGGRIGVNPAHAPLARTAIYALRRAPDGALWAGVLEGGLYHVAGSGVTRIGPEQGLTHDDVSTIHFDAAGQLWIGTLDSGLYRSVEGHFEPYTPAEGLPGTRVAAIADGFDGALWIGTNGGLVRLKVPRFTVYSKSDGLAEDGVGDIYQDPEGAVWAATDSGVSRFADGAFTTFTTRDGLPSDRIRNIVWDANGAPLVQTRGGFARWTGERFVAVPEIAGYTSDRVSAVLRSRSGALWLGIPNSGVVRLRDGHTTLYTTAQGLADDSVLNLFEDRDGRIWVATMRGGITCIADDRLTSWSTDNGLADNHVKAFYQDAAGVIWIGTHGGGVSRLKDGTLSTIASRHGLHTDTVFRILEDDLGNLWMSSNRGIWRVRLAELNDVADGRRATVSSFAYGVADGMVSSEGVGAPLSGWKMRDGTLWFSTVGGVVVVDPRRRDTEPARVVVEGATVDREPVAVDRPLQLAAGQEDLEIEYTGLSWSRPQEIKFRYRLIGLDREWREAGTRRTAYYSHVPPGTYTFTVLADNGEGVWSPDGANLAIVVLPPIYLTWWFVTLATVGGIAVMGIAWHYRMSQLKRAHALQQEFSRQLLASQEQERQRIAAELHDGLGQRLVIIKTLMTLGLESSNGGGAGAARERLTEISAETSAAIDEVRNISYNLRPYQLDSLGLTKAVEALARTSTLASGIQLTLDLCELDQMVPADEEINVYRLVQESLTNIVKHSRARAAQVSGRRDDGHVVLTISDNGVGFTPSAGGRDGRRGFGLLGLTERAQLLGGTAAVQSTPGQGTTITISVPVRGRDDGR